MLYNYLIAIILILVCTYMLRSLHIIKKGKLTDKRYIFTSLLWDSTRFVQLNFSIFECYMIIMKYLVLFILFFSPCILFAGTGETLQVQSFYGAIGGLLILLLFYEKIKNSIKLISMRIFNWVTLKKNRFMKRFRDENLKNDFFLSRLYPFSID